MRLLFGPSFIALPLALLASGCDKPSANASQPAQEEAAEVHTTKATIDTSHRGAALVADAFLDPVGKPVTLAAFNGQPMLVNLWATWCGPCVKEMPALDRLAARMKGKLRVVVVNQDSAKQAVDPVPGWWATHKLANLQLYRDPENNLGFAIGGGMLPTTVLYDAAGKEVWRLNGEMDWDGIAAGKALASMG